MKFIGISILRIIVHRDTLKKGSPQHKQQPRLRIAITCCDILFITGYMFLGNTCESLPGPIHVF